MGSVYLIYARSNVVDDVEDVLLYPLQRREHRHPEDEGLSGNIPQKNMLELRTDPPTYARAFV
jgi:hypothetical protein